MYIRQPSPPKCRIVVVDVAILAWSELLEEWNPPESCSRLMAGAPCSSDEHSRGLPVGSLPANSYLLAQGAFSWHGMYHSRCCKNSRRNVAVGNDVFSLSLLRQAQVKDPGKG